MGATVLRKMRRKSLRIFLPPRKIWIEKHSKPNDEAATSTDHGAITTNDFFSVVSAVPEWIPRLLSIIPDLLTGGID